MNPSPFFAAFLQFAVILGVGILPLTWRFQQPFFDLLLSFGAGVLLSAALLHMLPAAIPALGPLTGLFVLLGYLLMTFVEHFTMAHPCGEDHCPNHRIGLVAFLGLSIHSIIAGLALGVGLVGATDISVSVALLAAILVHKIPETLALVGLLASSGWTKKQMILGLVAFALVGPVGILLGSVVQMQSPLFLNGALGISTGTFLYIASSDLLPHLHRKMKQQWMHLLAFLVGVFILSFEAWHHIATG